LDLGADGEGRGANKLTVGAVPGAVGSAAAPLNRNTAGARRGDRRPRRGAARSVGSAIVRSSGPGAAVVYLSLLVLIPIAAVATQAFDGGWSTFWSAVRSPESWAALQLTLLSAAIVVAVNVVAGTTIAWVLVRDDFPGKRLLGALVDLPFALPTVIAGLTLLSLYGPDSPIHLDVANTRLAIWIALAFVTLPFAVRSVQPVLEELDLDAEEAASSLGAGSLTIFRRIVLPSLAPAMLQGAALSFARALGEYGSLVLFTSGLPFKTMVASIDIFGLYEADDYQAAAAVSLALLIMSLAVLIALGVLRRHFARDEVSA
jgi:sulfate/thiosulfate transport system permease protein